MSRRPRAHALVLAAALAAGCASSRDEAPPVTCLPLAGTWDVVVDLDPQQPGTSVCPVTWSVAQAGCDVRVAAALPCPACFLDSPDCWGAAGQASGSPDGSLRLSWSWRDPYPCDYVASLDARTDGSALSGTVLVEQIWASGGTCTGFVQAYPVTGTRRSAAAPPDARHVRR